MRRVLAAAVCALRGALPFEQSCGDHGGVPSSPGDTGPVSALPAWPLATYLAIGLLLRLPAVFFAHGFEFIDQQYQYIDPAWHLATGAAWHRPWEWEADIRSEIYPWFLATIFRALAWLGLQEPMATMGALRTVHALLSLLPLWLFWLVVVRWRPVAAPRLPLLLFAASGLLIGNVQPNGPALAATLAVAAGLALAGPRGMPLLAGLCLGLAFCCRFQDALFGPGFLAVLLWQRRWGGSALFALGCLPGIVLQGAVDVAAGGAFLGTPWRYVVSNVGLGAASKWHTQPFPFYLYAGVVPVLCLVPPLLRVAAARIGAGARLLPAACAGAACHLLLHSFVARKTLRFEQGALSLLLAVVAAGLPAARGRWARWHSAALVAMHAWLWLSASLWYGNAGAVQLACWLHEQRDYDGRIATIGGDATMLGGYFYARPSSDGAISVPREDVRTWLAANAAALPPLLVTARAPLTQDEMANAPYELVATFYGFLDWRVGERRFAYRRRSSRRPISPAGSRRSCRRRRS